MVSGRRCLSFWVIILFLTVSMVLMLMGQTMAVFDYEFTVKLGLQEDVKEVGEFGVQMNRAFGAGDTVVYIPLMAISLVGLFLRKHWSLVTTAAVMGISAYWAIVIIFIMTFMPGVPNYSFEPGPGVWLFVVAHAVFGVWGLFYMIFRRDELIR
ncbi:MAG: hypothetical protein JRF69_10610 [Deltaproteobacteria bacterium]|nr:hypothetical protein [Deltaproteobacteria bacterium]